MSSQYQSRQHPTTTIDPTAQILPGDNPVPLVNAAAQRGSLQPPHTKVEREIHDGCKPVFWLSGQHRAVVAAAWR